MPYKVNEPVEPQQRAVIDDDQLKRMMADSQPSFFERNRYRLVTLALIAINVAVFALESVLSGMRIDISTRTLVDMGAMYAPLVQSPADLYRFVTPMFLHMDLMHLGFNMVALYSVGEVLERTLGKGSYHAVSGFHHENHCRLGAGKYYVALFRSCVELTAGRFDFDLQRYARAALCEPLDARGMDM